SPTIMTRIVTLLEKEKIPFSRVLRIFDKQVGDTIYLRINTFKIAAVLELLEENEFVVKKG
ncbi:MAG: acetoin utilization protein AcuB, partial [Desulfocapsa sp.]|nr:acetoin utilization protein AcuB [Desulfocapsa sp.]